MERERLVDRQAGENQCEHLPLARVAVELPPLRSRDECEEGGADQENRGGVPGRDGALIGEVKAPRDQVGIVVADEIEGARGSLGHDTRDDDAGRHGRERGGYRPRRDPNGHYLDSSSTLVSGSRPGEPNRRP